MTVMATRSAIAIRGCLGDIRPMTPRATRSADQNQIFFGGYTHYDSKGNKVGRSEPGIFGGYTKVGWLQKKGYESDPYDDLER